MLFITAETSSSSWAPTTPNRKTPEKAAANNNGKERDAQTSARTENGIKATSGTSALQARKAARKGRNERKAPKARRARKEEKVQALHLQQIGHRTGQLPSGERQSASNTTRTGHVSMATTVGLIIITAYRKSPVDNHAGPHSTKVRTATFRPRREHQLD